MEKQKKDLIMRTLLVIYINRKGIIPLNSDLLDSTLARLLNNPEFRGLGITLKDMKTLYSELCQNALVSL